MKLIRSNPISRHSRLARLASLFLLCLVSTLGHAQSSNPDDGSRDDPPDRVARLSYLAGDLGFLPAGATDWSDAAINRPLTRGDRLASGADSRAELELDSASVRMDAGTDLGFLQLDDRLAQLELTRGTLNLSVRSLGPDQSYEIDTPTVALVVDQPGVFRVDVDDQSGATRVTAVDGQATVYGENNASQSVVGGHSYRFDDSLLAQVDQRYAGNGDGFDQWCAERDQRYAQSPSRQYVSEEVVGYEDLDHYGAWQSDADYGQVWYPAYVTRDWAPYREGHWAYVAPWGWTWVDDAPWGFAPYHYGRWVSLHGRWGWIPGPRGLRPIYAPALVAFVGGSSWNVSVGLGGPIGWFPLGPGDIYDPWYRASRGYYRRVNEHNIDWGRHHRDRDRDIGRIDEHYRHYRDGRTDPHQHYANREAPHGITAVSRDTFVHARRVQHDRMRVDPRQWRKAPVLAHGTGLTPVRASLTGPTGTHGRSPVVGQFNRAVVAHRPPPASAHGGPRQADRTAARANVRVLGNTAPVRAPATPPVNRRAVEANPLSNRLPSSRFVRAAPARDEAQAPRPSFARGQHDRAGATLPVVPRLMRGNPAAVAAQGEPPRSYRPPRDVARPATLPNPPRIESADQASQRAWRGRDAMPTRVVQAPAARFENRPVRVAEPSRQEATRMPVMQAPRTFQPQPRQAAPVPQQRSFTPAPRAYAPPAQPAQRAPARRAAPAKAKASDDGNGSAGRFRHR